MDPLSGLDESQYLNRVSAAAPDEVFDLARKIPETENVRVHEDILSIAARLPGRLAAKLTRMEADWLADYDAR